jgi:Protein of unknown function (DUF3096)
VVKYLSKRGLAMYHPYAASIVAIIAGILILVQPKLLNYVVALYLIIVGALGLLHP